MKVCVYFVPREGVHPTAKLDDYYRLWPIMKRHVNQLGYSLVHLTDMHTPNMGDEVERFHVPPETTIYSRDVAWWFYVRSLPDDETACMIEPDTVLLKEIPPLSEGYDLVLLRRSKPIIPGWFKMARRSATEFFAQVSSEYLGMPDRDWVFHGDITALHRVVKRNTHGCKIEWRDWTRYGFRKAPNADPIMLQFKGDSKHEMLRFA